MGYSLSSKFDEFRQNLEVSDSKIEKIITSHTHLRQNILQSLNYVKETFLTGSYKRKTLIDPPNDVDIFVVLSGYSVNTKPQSVLDKLKRDLIAKYPNSTIKQDKPCIVIDFNHCKFELTPAIEYSSFYCIPKDNDNWQFVEDPDILGKKLINANARVNYMLVPLIKMLKQWIRYNNIKMKSFELELKCINNITSINSYREGIQQFLQLNNFYKYYHLSSYSDEQFAIVCRNELFGNKFPM